MDNEEKTINVTLDAETHKKLEAQADEHDRATKREAAFIIKQAVNR